MRDWTDTLRIQSAKYNISTMKDDKINDRWGIFKSLETEILSFKKKVREFGENIVTFVVHTLSKEDLLYVLQAAFGVFESFLYC
jgi:hypothetical protein